jgi:hypothetical protein
MGCAERLGLVDAYRKATEMLLASLTELHSRMRTVDKDEYDRQRRITDEDRMKAEHARLEIEHVARSPMLRSSCG